MNYICMIQGRAFDSVGFGTSQVAQFEKHPIPHDKNGRNRFQIGGR
jgi:hypothetical protein